MTSVLVKYVFVCVIHFTVNYCITPEMRLTQLLNDISSRQSKCLKSADFGSQNHLTQMNSV